MINIDTLRRSTKAYFKSKHLIEVVFEGERDGFGASEGVRLDPL